MAIGSPQSGGAELFWSPGTVKPLNFNYEFEPNLDNQKANIWTLTDDLFVRDRQTRGETTENDVSSQRKVNQVMSLSKQKCFPSVEEVSYQRSSQNDNSLCSEKFLSPLESGESTPHNSYNTRSTFRDAGSSNVRNRPPNETKPKGLTTKLSEEERQKLLKSLDFRVRTRRKYKSMEEPVTMNLLQAPIPKKQAADKLDGREFLSTARRREISQNRQMRSAEQTSSSTSSGNKSSASQSTRESTRPIVGLKPGMKGTKISTESASTKTRVRELARRTANPDQYSVDPFSEKVSAPKIKMASSKTIPKVTINNQLLKSHAVNAELPIAEKKPLKKLALKKDRTAGKSFWTGEKLALLDQITNDKQMKAALLSAGNAYVKSKILAKPVWNSSKPVKKEVALNVDKPLPVAANSTSYTYKQQTNVEITESAEGIQHNSKHEESQETPSPVDTIAPKTTPAAAPKKAVKPSKKESPTKLKATAPSAKPGKKIVTTNKTHKAPKLANKLENVTTKTKQQGKRTKLFSSKAAEGKLSPKATGETPTLKKSSVVSD